MLIMEVPELAQASEKSAGVASLSKRGHSGGNKTSKLGMFLVVETQAGTKPRPRGTLTMTRGELSHDQGGLNHN